MKGATCTLKVNVETWVRKKIGEKEDVSDKTMVDLFIWLGCTKQRRFLFDL